MPGKFQYYWNYYILEKKIYRADAEAYPPNDPSVDQCAHPDGTHKMPQDRMIVPMIVSDRGKHGHTRSGLEMAGVIMPTRAGQNMVFTIVPNLIGMVEIALHEDAYYQRRRHMLIEGNCRP